jgi:hypothetical protein
MTIYETVEGHGWSAGELAQQQANRVRLHIYTDYAYTHTSGSEGTSMTSTVTDEETEGLLIGGEVVRGALWALICVCLHR